jgi:hypothetical protein
MGIIVIMYMLPIMGIKASEIVNLAFSYRKPIKKATQLPEWLFCYLGQTLRLEPDRALINASL